MATPYNQPTSTPTAKVAAVGIAGAVTVLVLALVEYFTRVEVSSEVASSLTLVISFAFGYFTRDTAPEYTDNITNPGA